MAAGLALGIVAFIQRRKINERNNRNKRASAMELMEWDISDGAGELGGCESARAACAVTIPAYATGGGYEYELSTMDEHHYS